MPFNFEYITAEKAAELNVNGNGRGVKYYRHLARNKKSCDNCGNPVWRLAELSMCFSCVTGESDASNDYELLEER